MALHKPAKSPLDVKLARGGLVDLEFLTHFLQLRDGAGIPGALTPFLGDALRVLAGAGLLPKQLGDWIKQMPPPWGSYLPAVLCLGIYTSVRVAEQVKAGIQSLPHGQGMAGMAIGLTLPQTYRFVLLPMAFRIVMPPLTSEFLNIIKNSSVALTIGLLELTGRARAMQEFSFKVFEAFSAATVIYLVTNLVIVLLMRKLENKIRVPGFIASPTQITPGH